MAKKLSLIFLALLFAGLRAYLWVRAPFKDTAGTRPPGRAILSYYLININTAGAEELDSLPNIGKKTAQNILAYRTGHGKFATIEELKKVKGVSEKTFLKLKERISAE